MLVEHREVSVSSGGPLLVIRASSGQSDSGENLGDSFLLANALPPIVFNGFEAVGNMLFLIRGLSLVPMFGH